MRPPRLAEPPHQRRVARLEEDQHRVEPRHRFAAAARPSGTATGTCPRGRRRRCATFVDARRLRAATASPASGSSVRRQVVDAEVAEVLERANRLRLARARQPGEHDERRAAARALPRPAQAAPPARAALGRLISSASWLDPRRLVGVAADSRPLAQRRVEALGQLARRVMARALAAAGCARRLRPGWRCCGPGATGMRMSGTRRPRTRRTHRRGRAARTRASDPSARAARRARPASTSASTRCRTAPGR